MTFVDTPRLNINNTMVNLKNQIVKKQNFPAATYNWTKNDKLY